MALDVGKFIKAPEYDVKIISRRDVFQASVCEEGRFSDECLELSALIVLDAADIKMGQCGCQGHGITQGRTKRSGIYG